MLHCPRMTLTNAPVLCAPGMGCSMVPSIQLRTVLFAAPIKEALAMPRPSSNSLNRAAQSVRLTGGVVTELSPMSDGKSAAKQRNLPQRPATVAYHIVALSDIAGSSTTGMPGVGPHAIT